MMTEPQPQSMTDSGGNRIAKRTLKNDILDYFFAKIVNFGVMERVLK